MRSTTKHGSVECKPVTIGFIADPHNGAVGGLTSKPESKIQRKLLECFNDATEWFGDLDYLITAGDLTHGESPKDHDTSSVHDPADQAVDVVQLLKRVRAKKFVIVSGTPFHVGNLTQIEKTVAGMLNEGGRPAVFRHRLRQIVNGWFRLEVRHKIGASGVPYARGTSGARARIWNVLNSALLAATQGGRPEWADLLCFAHVHYFWMTRDSFGTSVTLPSFCASGGRFDLEQCDGVISIGAFKVTIGTKEDGTWQHKDKLYPLAVQRAWEAL